MGVVSPSVGVGRERTPRTHSTPSPSGRDERTQSRAPTVAPTHDGVRGRMEGTDLPVNPTSGEAHPRV